MSAMFLTCVIYLTLPGLITMFHCPCSSMSECAPQRPPNDFSKEVFVVSNGSSDFTKWKWDTITAVLVPEEFRKTDIMCYTHGQKKRFGFIATLNHADHFDSLNNKTKKRIDEITDLVQTTNAEIIAVNIIDVVVKLHKDTDEVKNFGDILIEIKKAVLLNKENPVQMMCIVPWKPQCYGDNCKFTDKIVYHACDLIIIDPSSFAAIEPGYSCKARASVPFTHLALGVDEYAAQGIPEKRVILGVPWHGYKYTCDNYHYTGTPASDCSLKMGTASNNKTFCDYQGSRTKITIGEMLDQHTEEITKSFWSQVYQAPVYSHYDNATGVFSQIWFENVMSLRLKYQYAHDFELKGIAIYYAEDLSQSVTPANKAFVGGMWDWVLHGILKKTVTQPAPVKYHADVVAGASIGCLLLGLLLGVLFTCLALRHRVKKNREIPFKRDQIEYHDEDDNLHL